MRLAQARGFSAGEFYLLLLVFDLDLALGPEALDREILELAPIGRVRNRVHAMGFRAGLSPPRLPQELKAARASSPNRRARRPTTPDNRARPSDGSSGRHAS
jgi:hypothetical protein